MSNIRLLLLEDSPEDEKLIIRQFKKNGYDVFYQCLQTAEDLRRALEAACWDLIISDYQMPTFSGIVALEIAKDYNTDIPFIIISGAIGEDTAIEAMRAGADDYLMKQNLQRLIPAVERAMREAGNRKQRKWAEQEVEDLHLQLEGIFSSAMDAIVTTNESHNIIMFNEAARNMFGYTKEETLGKHLNILLPYSYRKEHTSHMNEFGASGKTARRMGIGPTLYGLHANGNVFPIEASISHVNLNGKKFFTAIIRDISERQKTTEQLHQMHEQMLNARLKEQFIQTSALLEGQEIERKRLGREIHDGLGQMLNVLKMQLSRDFPAMQAKETLDHIITEVKRINNDLMPLVLQDFGLDAGIKQLIEQYQKITEAEFYYFSDVNEERFEAKLEVGIYRIVQEALSNAVKYAHAKNISVQLTRQPASLLLLVEDDGVGFDKNINQPHKGFGLLNMQFRVEVLHGKFSIESQPGRGCLINVEFNL